MESVPALKPSCVWLSTMLYIQHLLMSPGKCPSAPTRDVLLTIEAKMATFGICRLAQAEGRRQVILGGISFPDEPYRALGQDTVGLLCEGDSWLGRGRKLG